MLEMKVKSTTVAKCNKETNTVETGSTHKTIGKPSETDYMQDKTVKETLFNLNTKISRLQLDVTSLTVGIQDFLCVFGP